MMTDDEARRLALRMTMSTVDDVCAMMRKEGLPPAVIIRVRNRVMYGHPDGADGVTRDMCLGGAEERHDRHLASVKLSPVGAMDDGRDVYARASALDKLDRIEAAEVVTAEVVEKVLARRRSLFGIRRRD